MQNTYRQLVWGISFRRFFAAAFLIVLLAEWGSHSVAFTHSYSGELHAVQCEEGAHEDLCKTLIRCSDGPRQEQPVPASGHDLSQSNPLLDYFAHARPFVIHKDPRIPRSRIRGLSRPVDPHFHPPELS